MLDGRLDAAAQALDAVAPRVAALAPTSSLPARLALARGTVARLRGDAPAALRHLQPLADSSEAAPKWQRARMRAWAQIGLVELEQSAPDRAVASFERALKEFDRLETRITPARAEALIGLGRVHLAQGDPGKALPLLEQADAVLARLRSGEPPRQRCRCGAGARQGRTARLTPAGPFFCARMSGMAGFDRPSASSRGMERASTRHGAVSICCPPPWTPRNSHRACGPLGQGAHRAARPIPRRSQRPARTDDIARALCSRVAAAGPEQPRHGAALVPLGAHHRTPCVVVVRQAGHRIAQRARITGTKFGYSERIHAASGFDSFSKVGACGRRLIRRPTRQPHPLIDSKDIDHEIPSRPGS